MSQITLLKYCCDTVFPATKTTHGRRTSWLMVLLSILWQLPTQAATRDSINTPTGVKPTPRTAFRATAQGPGGVSAGLGGWYRGDKGLSSAQWNDYSGNNKNIPQPTASAQPGVNAAGPNFNPTATFNSTQFFGLRGAVDPASSVFGTASPTRIAVFSVATVSQAHTGGLFYQKVNNGQTNGTGIDVTNCWTNGYAYFDAPYTDRVSNPWGGITGQPHLWSFTKTPANMAILRDRNTVANTNGTYTTAGPGNNYASNIGLWADVSTSHYQGSISEVIVYKDITTLTATDQQKIESYLAFKYGITLNQTTPTDYLASDGSKMWTGDATFKSNITGIGRDDASSLEQKQSVSAGDAYLTIALGSQVAASNAANTNSVTNDLSFLTMADNGLATNLFGTAVSTPLNAGISTRMARIWKVQKTNWVDQTITLNAGFTGGFKYLIISTGPGFAAAAITKVIPFTGNNVTLNSSDLPATAYITIGVAAKGPGGVNAGIGAWYKGDKGLSSAQWNDFSGLDMNIPQPTATLQPTVSAGAVNFNPTPVFDNTRFYGKGPIKDPATSVLGNGSVQNFAVYAAVQTNSNGGGNSIFWQETDNVTTNRIQAHVPWPDGTLYFDGPMSQRVSAPWGGTFKKPTVWTFAKTATSVSVLRDHNTLISQASTAFTGTGGNNAFQIGNSAAGNIGFNGYIPEMIVYKDISTHTGNERIRIESYLALKYGVTLSQTTPTDYIASNSSKMWTADATYKYCITGIGRDDVSDLQQKQSLSVEAGGIITLALGSQVAATNAANSNSVTNDLSFFTIADNALVAASYDIATSTPLNPQVTRRMARVWKVQKTNWADQNITLQPNINGSTKYLLISTDPAFGSAAITKVIPFTGNTVTLNTSDLPNGAYFTFGKALTAPGGIIDVKLDMWMKANDGVLAGDGSKVVVWKNLIDTKNYDVSTTSVPDQPVFYDRTASQLLNFNPSMVYKGTENPANVLRNTARLFPNTSAFQMIAVGMDRRTTWTGTSGGLLASGPGGNNPVLYLLKSAGAGSTNGWAAFMGSGSTGPAVNPAAFNTSNAIIYNGGSPGFTNVQPQIFSMGSPNNGTTATADNIACWVDGFKENTALDAVQQPEIGNGILVGSSDDNSTWWGNIPEVIVYERQLTDAEMAKVNTYLAIKYGITMDQRTPYNYIATDASVIWNATTNSTYKNNIAGIGRDDIQDLRQKQSRSVNGGFQVAVGLADLAPTNNDNNGSFSNDKAYLVWGDDNGVTNFRTAVSGHPIVNFRMARIWKTQQTAAMGEQVQIAVPYDVLPNSKETYLIVSNDNIFDGTDQFIKLSEITLQGVKHFAAKVNLTNGQYFTFGSYIKAPGGVGGTSLWLRPDYGTSTTSDGAPVDTWIDYAADLNNATMPLAGTKPTFANNATYNVNFNPQIVFNGSQSMNLDVTKLPTGTNPRTLFGFGRPTNTAGNGYIISWGTNNTSLGQGLAAITGTAGYYVGISNDVNAANFWKPNSPNILIGTYTGAAAGAMATIYSKTKLLAPSLAKPGWNTGTTTANIGKFIGNTSENWKGGIGDVIVYPYALDATQLRRVESYLAVKYGYTLDQTTPGNYLATDGSVIWDATTNGNYKQNITAIGLDNVEGLEQKQSRSIETGGIVAIGLDSIYSDNPSNTGSFDNDKSYMFWATNSTSMATINTNTPKGSCVTERLAQQWKVQYANFSPAAKQLAFSFDLTGVTYTGTDTRDFTLLIDNDGDGDFTTGTITAYKAGNYNATNKTVSFSGVNNIPAGAVFTLTTRQPVRIAKLVADGQSVTAASICKEDDWIYFVDPIDATKYIAAINLNGNTVNMTDFNAALVDVGKNMAALGANGGTDYGTQLMRRLLQIKYTGAPLTVNGGVSLRYLWNPAEQTAASTYLSGTRNVPTTQQWSWFRHSGDIAATMTDVSPVALNNAVQLVPTSTGKVDGVDYVQFDGLQQFDVFGGLYNASQVVSVQKVQDGAEGGQDGQFSINLPNNVTVQEDLTVNYAITGTAINGTDYQTLSGQAILKAGTSQLILPVQVIDDNIIELTENVQIQLTSVTGTATGNLYSISTTQQQATLNIFDNDQDKAIIGVTKFKDAAEPADNGTFNISLPAGVTCVEDITVTYSIAGTATNGIDYTTLTGTLVIPKGMTGVTLPVEVIDDKLIEGPETVQLKLAGGVSTNFTFTVAPTAAAAEMTIADDDNTAANMVVSITPKANAAEPATNGSFLVSLPAGYAAGQPITVNYTVSGTATPDKDYKALSGSMTIPAGQNSVPLDVIVIDDKIIEGDETVVATITSASAPVLGAFTPDNTKFSATIIIADDDNTATNKVLSITKTADAAEPATNGRYKISLPAGITVAEAVTVNYKMSGTATNGTDYTTLNGTFVLQPGDNSAPLDLVVIDDKIIEGDETAIATLTGGNGATIGAFTVDAAATAATITIADDDNTAANKVVHIIAKGDAAEPAQNGSFEIGLPTGITAVSPVTVNYTITGTATNGTDYTTLNGSVTIPAGQNTVPLPVIVIDDKIIEGTETVINTLNNANSTTFGAFTIDAVAKAATVNIADDDNTAANLVLNITKTADAAEPATNGAFSIALPAGYTAAEDITINYTVSGTATNGTDYQLLSSPIKLPAGNNSITLPVVVIDDKIIEGDESVIVTINNGTSTSFALQPGTSKVASLTIADDDNTAANKIISAVKIADAAEPATNGAFMLQLPNGVTATEAITVHYTVAGTATPGADYTTLSGTAVIPAGSNGVTVPVLVIDDTIIEGDETVLITPTGGTSATFGNYTADPTVATVIIKDDDNIDNNKILSITKTTDAAEPSTNGGFVISLPTAVTLTQPVTVNYTVSGTATNGVDYQNLSGTVVIPAGQNSVALPVVVIDDKIIEVNETVIVNISGGTATNYGVFSASSTNGSATVTIADDDNTPANNQLTITKTADAAEPATNGSFAISLPTGYTSSEDITVNYTVSGTATPTADYVALSGTAVIPAGQNSITLAVTVKDDKIIEGDETVIATLTGGASAHFTFTGSNTATVTIADDDNIPANKLIGVLNMKNGAEPNTSGQFGITLFNGYTVAEPVTVNYTVSGTATNGVDYVTLTGTATIPAGQTNVFVPINVIDDQIIEGTETVVITLANASSTTFGTFPVSNTPATVNIADDDNTAANKVVHITKVSDAAEPATNGAFNIGLPNGITVAEDVTVHYQVSGTATNGVDYQTLNGTITIPAGQNNVNLPVNVIDDKIVEGTENVIVTLTDGASTNFAFTGDPTAGNATLYIADDDAAGTLSIVKTIDAAEPATNGQFSISLPTGITYANDITVNYTVTGTATPGADYSTLSGSILIPAGQNSVTLTVPVLDDKIIENTETVIVTLTGGTATGFAPLDVNPAQATATVNIADDDNTAANKLMSISKTADAAEPATNGGFKISLPAGVTVVENVTVNYTITGTATNGIDYTTLTGTATIPAGSNSVPLDVVVIDDKIIENTETVIATLNTGNSSSFGTFGVNPVANTATVNIADDDNTAANKKVSVMKMRDGGEPNTNGQFGISLPANITSSEPITVNYTIAGTATNGVDYATLSGTAIIPAGQNMLTVDVNVIDDKIIEGTETVVMTLNNASSPSFGFTIGTATATVNIADDDATTTNRTLSIAKVADAAEPSTNGSFRISLPNGITSAAPIKVTYQIDPNSTATPDADYTAITGDIIIPAGNNSVLVPVNVIDDQIIEPVETVIMNINGGDDGAFTYTTAPAAATATVYITDDDFTPNSNIVLVTKVSDAIEGSVHGQFKISLPPGITASEAVTVHYAMGGTATNTLDYVTLNGVAVIPAGSNYVLVDVDAFDDGIVEGPEQAVMTLIGASSSTYNFNIAPGKGSATVTIIDANAASSVPVTVTKVADAAEPATNGKFRVSLVGSTSAYPVTVGYTLSGTADAGIDYNITGSVVIPANTASVDVDVNVIDDKIIEGPETVIFKVISGSATDGAGNAFIFPADAISSATVTIADDDDIPANLKLTATNEHNAAEPDFNGAFRISLPLGYTASTDIKVQYTLSGTATKDADYSIAATATIPHGQNFVILPVTIIDDKIIEPTETVILTLTSGVDGTSHNYTPAGTAATVNIADDDGTDINKQLTITKVADAAEPNTNGRFQISLPAGITSAEAITVNFKVAGTATEGTDYQTLGTSIVLPANQNSVFVDVAVIDDKIIEGDETVQLTLAGGTTATLGAFTGTSNASLVIADDDNVAANRVLQVKQTLHAAEPATNGNFRVSLPAGYSSSRDITLQYTLSGTATRDVDYTVNTITIPALSNGVDIPVTVIDDKIIEPTETVIMALANTTDNNGNDYTVDASFGTATVNIADDDITIPANKVLVVTKFADAAEPGTNGGFLISLPTNITASEDIQVTYNITGTATNGTDYQTLSGTVTLPANSNSVKVDVTTIDDKIIEGDETVIMTLTGGTTTTIGAFTGNNSATVIIADDDNTITNQVLKVVRKSDASEPATNGAFEISLPTGITAAQDITVHYTIAGTATNGIDYTTLNGTVVLPHGQETVAVPVLVIDDKIIEQPETVILQITNGTSTSFNYKADATAGRATVTIADDDDISANKVLSVTKANDAAEPGTNGAFTISLPTGVTATDDITVNYAITGTATNGTDYTIDATATIPAGQNSVNVSVNVIDDKIIEGTETVVMTLGDGQSATFGSFTIDPTKATATVNIADDDDILANKQLSIVNISDAAEPATNGKFMISLPTGVTVAEDLTIQYTIAGTATNGTDYTTLNGTVVMPAGQSSVEMPVMVIDDKIIEENETVIATLTGGASTKFTGFQPAATAATATVTIMDDDNTTANRVISIIKGADAAEPAINGAFIFSLPAGLTASAPVTITYTVGGTATPGVDYRTLSGTVTIPAGENRVTVPVTVIDDLIVEETENVTATISTITATGLGNFAASSTQGAATVLIADDDNIPANRVLSVVKTTDAAEPSTNGAFTISLPTGITFTDDVTVNYTISGTATNGVDYTMSATATIPAGQNSVSVAVNVIDDKIIEGDETVILTLADGKSSTFGSFTINPAQAAATVTIADDDDNATNRQLSVVKLADAAEPGTNGAFSISLPAGITAAQAITVNYTISGTATNGVDYTITSTATIAAGDNQVTIPVVVIDDKIIEGPEDVVLTLNGGTTTSLGNFTVNSANATATVTIADDDDVAANLVLNITATIPNASEPATNGEVTIALPAGYTATHDITVQYTVAGTATGGVDYKALSGTVIIPAGTNSVKVPVEVIDNKIQDGTRTVDFTLTGGTGGSWNFVPATANATVNILDDDIQSFDTWKKVALPVENTSGVATPNETLTYTIYVRNTGNVPITQVTITDPVPANTIYVSGGTLNGNDVIFNINNVAPGATVTATLIVKTPASLDGVTSISNTAEVTDGRTTKSTMGCDPAAPGCNAQTGTVIQASNVVGDLVITKTVVNPPVGIYRMGQDITYSVKVKSVGTQIFTNVMVEDLLPPNLELPSTISTQVGLVDKTAGKVTWNIGTLPEGQEVEMTMVCRIVEGGDITNKATVKAKEPETDYTNNTAEVTIKAEGADITFPNVFTPNGDGKNEKFIIGGLEKYPGSAIYIYNRWGSMVYQSKDYHNDWNGSQLNEATYYYILEVKKPGGVVRYRGWVQILR